MENKFKCECGGSLQVVQEVSGSFVYDVDNKGRFDWDDREFYGDMDEYISCSKCEKVIDALARIDGYIEFSKDLK